MRKHLGMARRGKHRSGTSEKNTDSEQDRSEKEQFRLQILNVDIDRISLPFGGRKINDGTVAALVDSIGRIGLQHPISLIRLPGMVLKYELVAGAHRLSACRNLGHGQILAHVMSKADARIQRHAENLHRSDLVVLEKYDAIVGYERARKKAVLKWGAQPHDLGLSGTARELDLDRRIIRQARAAQAITESARVKLVSVGLDNHAGAIAKIAAKASSEDQLKAIDDLQGPRKLRKVRKNGKRMGAQPQSAAELLRRWQSSDFKKIFDLSNRLIREEFIRKNFAEPSVHANERA
jgi:ParB-like chromosome segregation protein Spo0J